MRFSSNWLKAKARIQRLHTRIANVRQDYLHKTSTTLCQSHAMLVIEDLQVKNISASARAALKHRVKMSGRSGD
ncbi:transposase [Nitrincola sp.]|uniref:transposase n=1 Tax=Nitrincola sp. TaxID=1926584 RepID=UPI003A8C9B92